MRLLILTQKVDEKDDNLGFFNRWLEEFAKHCEKIVVVCLFEGEHNLPANVRVLSLGKEAGVSRLKYLRRFYSYIWRERKNYDAVFVHMNQIYVILGGLLWRLWGKRIGLWYAHGSVPFSLRIATLLAHDVFTSTETGFHIKTKKKKIVGQGIDTELFAPVSGEKAQTLRIASVGRVEQVKHPELLIGALALVRTTYPDATLHFYGAPRGNTNTAYQAELEMFAQSAGVAGGVYFEGPVVYTALPAVLSRASVFAQASQTGSLDKAVLEALAMGLPAVSTNVAFCDVPGVVFVEQSSKAIGKGIIHSVQVPMNMRSYVIENHSLSRLIPHILGEISRPRCT